MKYTLEKVRPILATINDAGYLAYLTGGSVRDHLLYGNFDDIDIATDATPMQLSALFGIKRFDKFAAKFGTFKAVVQGLPVEITTFRVEAEYANHRHPSMLSFVKEPSLDAGRRDLTINAMYMDQYGAILDYYNGQQDLEHKLLRLIGDPYERLEEDPVRILRILRFMLQFNFEIEPGTESALIDKANLVDEISSERQKLELQKFLKIASLQEIQHAFDKYGIDVTTKL